MFSAEGSIVLVTGANRGIGEGYVRAFANAGAKKIYACARELSNLDALIKEFGDVICPVHLELENTSSIDALVSDIKELDVLVNNAGIISMTFCGDSNALEVLQQEMQVNLYGPMQLTNALIPVLKQSQGGAVINVSSIAGMANYPSIGTYSITKAAMNSYSQGLRYDLKDSAIKVINVSPGPHDTRLAEGNPMEKPAPINVANKTLEALDAGVNHVFPDGFSEQMYGLFTDDPEKLEAVFADAVEA